MSFKEIGNNIAVVWPLIVTVAVALIVFGIALKITEIYGARRKTFLRIRKER